MAQKAQKKKANDLRLEEFKMERPNLVRIGQEVEITERNTVAFYYYIIQPALAMSGNYSFGQRIRDRKGIVKDIRRDERGYFVYVEFEA